MNTLAGKGISVAAPAGGAWSMYTNWEQDGSRQWETFLADELPDWLAANKGLAPSGHGIVGAAQGGYGAMAMATFHPDRYRFAGSLSGFLAPEQTGVDGAITAGLAQFGGVDTRNMWGLPQLGRWKWHDPNVHVQLLADNNTRLWVFSPPDAGVQRSRRDDRLLRQAQGSNRTFYQHYRSVGGHNGHFDFPAGGNHDWGSWCRQLGRDVRRTRRHHQVGSGFASPGPPGAAGTLEGCSTRYDGRAGSAKWSATSLLVASSAALLTGCSVADDMMATVGLPTSEIRACARTGRRAATGTAAAERRTRTR